jgi:hypothetical protein
MKRILCYLAVLMFAFGEIAFANPSKYPILAYSPYASTGNAQCSVKAAREQAGIAMGLLNAGKYDQAYALAGSASEYLGSCHQAQDDDRVAGDAMFVVSVVEAKRSEARPGASRQHRRRHGHCAVSVLLSEIRCIERRHVVLSSDGAEDQFDVN